MNISGTQRKFSTKETYSLSYSLVGSSRFVENSQVQEHRNLEEIVIYPFERDIFSILAKLLKKVNFHNFLKGVLKIKKYSVNSASKLE